MASISSSVCLLFPFYLLIMIIPNALADYWGSDCPNSTMFESNSTYQTHLNQVFQSLSSHANSTNGFFYTSSGTNTLEPVYGLFLCRGDEESKTCQDCVTTATGALPNSYCPNRKRAVVWYDECMVRYSNQSIFGVMKAEPPVVLLNTQSITGNVSQFMEVMNQAMNNASIEAANGGSKKKYGTDVEMVNSLETMYTMAQCTPDLSTGDCNQCLRIATSLLPSSRGARVYQPSCNVRYEIYPFFNGATNISLSPPPSPPQGRTPVISPPTNVDRKHEVSSKVIIAIVLPVVAVSLIVLAVGVCLIRNINAKKDDVVADSTGDDFSTVESLQYDFVTLQTATNNFSDENKLGEGGFGGVYKGTLPNGQEVAVKRLSKSSSQGIQELKNEILLIAKLQHRNLVRLLGFAFNREEKLLVYEHVPNKSLDYFLFDPEKQVKLSWGSRYKIIKGIARGILYLHQDSRYKVVHRDLKASNILLDMDMNPKISDFGMARIFRVEESQGTTSRVVGTFGYMAPEYVMHGEFSFKSDVYSFGILVLEIVSGKSNPTFHQSGNGEDLLSFAWRKWTDGQFLEFVDPVIWESCSANEVMRCIQLGLLCAQDSVDKRPTMATVVLTLESYSVTLSVPEQPTLFGKSAIHSNIPSEIISDQSSNKSNPWSINEVSITQLDPR